MSLATSRILDLMKFTSWSVIPFPLSSAPYTSRTCEMAFLEKKAWVGNKRLKIRVINKSFRMVFICVIRKLIKKLIIDHDSWNVKINQITKLILKSYLCICPINLNLNEILKIYFFNVIFKGKKFIWDFEEMWLNNIWIKFKNFIKVQMNEGKSRL